MKTLQELLDEMGNSKIAKLPTKKVHHYYGNNMSEWRHSLDNRIKNMGQQRQDQKLTLEQAQEIRRLHWEENINMSDLSTRFGVAQIGIRKILNNKRFWVENPRYVGIKFRSVGKPKKIVYVYKSNKELIYTFESVTECSEFFNINIETIRQRCIRNKNSLVVVKTHKQPELIFTYKKLK